MREGEFSVLHPQLLGDLVISVETARRQRKRFGLDEMSMVTLLMIHGILHLLGYEHEGTKRGSREMAIKQKELLRCVT
jgi:rRNA maturation RNase YbeY